MKFYLSLSEEGGWIDDRQYFGMGVEDVKEGKVRLDVGDIVLWVRRRGDRYVIWGMGEVRRVAFRYYPFTWDGVIRKDEWREAGVDWWYIEALGELWVPVLVWERRKGWYDVVNRWGEGDVDFEMNFVLLDEVFAIEDNKKIGKRLERGELVPLESIKNGSKLGKAILVYYRKEKRELRRVRDDKESLVKSSNIFKTN